ncbi:NADH-quinone oxidoreductase subunit K [Bacteroidia bacterium]|nr:NADH-quinone oxidoreductase subunit K [Bacteroidia bacterium]
MIPIEHYLLLSAIVFFIGVYGFIARKNFLAMLISIELMLNAVELNFSVFNRYLFPQHLEGMFFTLFGIAIAAAETAIAIAIIVNIYRNLQNVDVQSAELMKN